eukprot:2675240-Pleurochrysis_carterae.AAC.1
MGCSARTMPATARRPASFSLSTSSMNAGFAHNLYRSAMERMGLGCRTSSIVSYGGDETKLNRA